MTANTYLWMEGVGVGAGGTYGRDFSGRDLRFWDFAREVRQHRQHSWGSLEGDGSERKNDDVWFAGSLARGFGIW
jgi:hypothetical protein